MESRIITINYLEFLNQIVYPFFEKIEDLKLKVKTVCDYELKKRSMSNVILELNEDIIRDIKKTIDMLKTYNISGKDKYIVNNIIDYYNIFTNEYNTAIESLDIFLTTAKSSQNNPNWNNAIENIIFELSVLIFNLLESISTKYQVERVTNNYETIENIRTNYERYITDNKKIISDLETKLEQKLYDKDILSIQTFYKDRLADTKKEHFWNQLFFYITFGVLIVFSVLMLLDILCFNKMFTKEELEFTKNNIIIYLLIVSLSGLLSYLMTDFRKRMNISKSIIDEISQKKVIIDSYSILLEKKKTISDENQKQYEQDLIASIFHNILSLKNNGYSHKDMQSVSPNYLVEIINKLIPPKAN